MEKSGTVRSCVSCRRKGRKGEFLKLANTPAGVVLDYSERLPGRGAYICPETGCIDKALKEGVLSRAFRKASRPPEADGFYADLKRNVERKINSLLGMARKSGLAALGFEAAAEKIRRSHGGLLIMALDMSDNTGRKLLETNTDARLRIARFSTKEGLGEALGAPPVGVVFIHGSALAEALDREIGRLISLSRG